MTWQHLYEDLLEDQLEALPLFEALLIGVRREHDELIAQQILGLLQGVWWRYLSATEHNARADELESVRDTGDIFFPLSWLHATLDGHHSQEAADIVLQFPTKLPG